MSDMLDSAPMLPRYDAEGAAAVLQGRRPGLGEYLGANVSEGWWGSTTGAWGAVAAETRGAQEDDRPMTREEWEGSGYARLLGPAWDERMTRGRAAAQARTYDETAYREALMAARDPSAFEMALGFGAQLVGSLADPVNFIPIGRGVELGLRGIGALRAAEVLARPGVAASALRGAVDAVGGNALAAPAIYAVHERYGEEITFDKVVADLAIGALIGAGFGTAGGLLSRRLQPDATVAVRTVDQAASDLAAGRPMEVPASLAARTLDDAVMRSAPPEMAGLRVADLPTAAGGLPLSRADFDAFVASRGTPEAFGLRRDLLSSTARVEIGPDGAPHAIEAGPAYVPSPMAPAGPSRAESVRAPVLNGDGQPVIALSRAEERAIGARLERQGERDISFVRIEGEPGAYAVANVAGAEVYRGQDGAPRVYPSVARAKTAARQIEGQWTPVETEGGAVLLRADAEMGRRMQANRRLMEVGPDFLSGRTPPAPEPAMALGEAIRADAYAWYREALDARRQMERLAAAPPDAQPVLGGTKQGPESQQGAEASTALPGPEAAQLEAMRAEGRLTAADEATLRAGDEAAAELQGVAKGLKEAAECLLRNMR